jgi:hypothetical protein
VVEGILAVVVVLSWEGRIEKDIFKSGFKRFVDLWPKTLSEKTLLA